ncbi:NUDIX hydrolase [Streptomyces longispororuber]|uniref:NUDIX hydrolase n=1 Tax=Streptomyces longispororuber TaxID=68230 RepID=UPI00210DF914|nr:NUDIX hydrolase [Streptomyces longispororuber]MCQ4211314.1 NUDIX hydrolase [Streptomyces longispororuber]
MGSVEGPPVVRAAGCVLWRAAARGGVELALVYRPKWADWSWPKGKLKRGESSREAALREVREETGMECRLGEELPSLQYVDAQGRPKTVRYWAARATGGAFVPGDEVTEVVWLSPREAGERLTHERDRGLLPAFLDALGRAQQGV